MLPNYSVFFLDVRAAGDEMCLALMWDEEKGLKGAYLDEREGDQGWVDLTRELELAL